MPTENRALSEIRKRWEAEFPGQDGRRVQLFASINALRRFSEEHYQEVLRPLDLTYSDYRVLSMLLLFDDDDGGLSPTDLLTSQVISSGGMTRLLDRLDTVGLIRRTRSRVDRRAVVVSLTARGRRTTRRACQAVWDSYDEVLAEATIADVERCIEELQSIAGLLQLGAAR